MEEPKNVLMQDDGNQEFIIGEAQHIDEFVQCWSKNHVKPDKMPVYSHNSQTYASFLIVEDLTQTQVKIKDVIKEKSKRRVLEPLIIN